MVPMSWLQILICLAACSVYLFVVARLVHQTGLTLRQKHGFYHVRESASVCPLLPRRPPFRFRFARV